jgi:hypothetical protein
VWVCGKNVSVVFVGYNITVPTADACGYARRM